MARLGCSLRRLRLPLLAALIAALAVAATGQSAPERILACGGNMVLGAANTCDGVTSLTGNVNNQLFTLTNTNTGASVFALTATANTPQATIRGINNGAGAGVRGTGNVGYGVIGTSTTAVGVQGTHGGATGTTSGVRGDSASNDTEASGVIGRMTSSTAGPRSAGVRGRSSSTDADGFGVFGSHSGSGIAVYGEPAAITGTGTGVKGVTSSPDGFGGVFDNQTAAAGTTGVAVLALGRSHDEPDVIIGPDGFDGAIEAAGPNGVEGNSNTPGGFGVSGDGPAVGVNGTATGAGGIGGNFYGGSTGTGVNALGGVNGVSAFGDSFGVDSSVTSAGAVAVRGTAGPSANDAVQGVTSNAIGDAVQATASGSAAFALFGIGSGPDGATGLVAVSSSNDGARVSTSDGADQGLQASNTADGGTAGLFVADTIGVEVDLSGGNSSFGIGVNADVSGDANGDGNLTNDGHQAIVARTDDTNADFTIGAFGAGPGDSLNHEAIEAFGFVDINGSARVTGNLDVVGACCGPMIDNPADPANSYLRHASVAAPAMKNMYDGVVKTSGDGRATVELPEYFGPLNKDFRYQLTVIGGEFVQAIVSDEIAAGGRTFEIRTSKPNVKVSWQVTGTRNDAYAQAHPLKVVEKKTGAAEGKYLHPEAFGKPASLSLDENHAKASTIAASDAVTAQSLKQTAADRAKAAEAQRPSTRTPAPTQSRQGSQSG